MGEGYCPRVIVKGSDCPGVIVRPPNILRSTVIGLILRYVVGAFCYHCSEVKVGAFHT